MISIESIRSRARRGTLEVEHLLALSKAVDPDVAAQLDRTATDFKWESDVEVARASRVVPLSAWSRVVSAFIRREWEGLRKLSVLPGYFGLVLAIVSANRSDAGLAFVLSMSEPLLNGSGSDPDAARDLTSFLNEVLSFSPRLTPPGEYVPVIRSFLHSRVRSQTDEGALGTAYCALRYIGDGESLSLPDSYPVAPHWQAAVDEMQRKVRKRLKTEKAMQQRTGKQTLRSV